MSDYEVEDVHYEAMVQDKIREEYEIWCRSDLLQLMKLPENRLATKCMSYSDPFIFDGRIIQASGRQPSKIFTSGGDPQAVKMIECHCLIKCFICLVNFRCDNIARRGSAWVCRQCSQGPSVLVIGCESVPLGCGDCKEQRNVCDMFFCPNCLEPMCFDCMYDHYKCAGCQLYIL